MSPKNGALPKRERHDNKGRKRKARVRSQHTSSRQNDTRLRPTWPQTWGVGSYHGGKSERGSGSENIQVNAEYRNTHFLKRSPKLAEQAQQRFIGRTAKYKGGGHQGEDVYCRKLWCWCRRLIISRTPV